MRAPDVRVGPRALPGTVALACLGAARPAAVASPSAPTDPVVVAGWRAVVRGG